MPAVPALRARRIAAAVIALALGAAAWTQVAAIEPSLRIRPARAARNDKFDVWNVLVESHGGEALEEVAIEPVSGPVTFDGGTSIKDLPAQWRVTFVVRIAGPDPRTAHVRVVQKGSTSHRYDVALGDGK